MKGRLIGIVVAWTVSTSFGCGHSSEDPASPPLDLPAVVSLGGQVLTAPRFQPIYFPGFPFATETDAFLAALAGSQYWSQVNTEYGVGRPTVLPADATMVPAPDTLGADDVNALLASVFAADAAKLGAARADTIYVLMLPPTTSLTAGEVTFCASGASGFHAEAEVSGTHVPVAVLPACSTFAGQADITGFAAISPALAHELIEASSDPLVDSAPAFARTDDRHPMWTIALEGGENADLCENESPNLIMSAELGQPVPRVWSNAAAMANRDPCLPLPSGEGYFVTVPRLPDTSQIPLEGGASLTVPSVVASVGASATVTVDFRGLAGAPASWQAVALEFHGEEALMQMVSGMRATPVNGRNGETHTLPVQVPSMPSAGVFPLIILAHSTAGSLHLWVGTIERK